MCCKSGCMVLLSVSASNLADVDPALVVLDADDLRLEEAVAVEVLVLGVLCEQGRVRRGANAG